MVNPGMLIKRAAVLKPSALQPQSGSREKLHVVERWTRTGPDTLEYVITAEDAIVWTAPWTARQEFTRQSDRENRLYTESRCIEETSACRRSFTPAGWRKPPSLQAAARIRPRWDSTHGSFVLDEDPLR
jgi:hypothetical protein